MNDISSAIIMSVNYSHDIATALLAVSGAAMWIISANYPAAATTEAERFFIRVYHGITRLAKGALIWILVAGAPRIYFYTEYEWSSAAGDIQVVAIIIKHVLMFLLVGTGLFYWLKLGKKISRVKLTLNDS